MLMYLLPNKFVENMYTPYPIMQYYGSSLVCSLHSVCTNAQDKLNTLHLAACGGHVEIVKYLIPKFAIGDRRFDLTIAGNTCLHYAAREGHLAVVKYLTEECGFNPNLGNKVSCCVYVYILYVVSTFSVVCT